MFEEVVLNQLLMLKHGRALMKAKLEQEVRLNLHHRNHAR